MFEGIEGVGSVHVHAGIREKQKNTEPEEFSENEIYHAMELMAF